MYSPYQAYKEIENPENLLDMGYRTKGSFQNLQPPTAADFSANGRVYFKENETPPQYEFYSGSNKPSKMPDTNLCSARLDSTKLSIAFFDQSNLEYLQKNIIDKVYSASSGKYKISRQSDAELQIIMRSYYLQYGKNMKNNIEKQIQELNVLVSNYAVENILPEIEQQLKYRRDIRTPIEPIALPKSVNTSGSKTYSLFNY